MTKRLCVICGEELKQYISPSRLKSGRGKCCSKKCRGVYLKDVNKKGENRKCVSCGKDFYHKPSEDRRGYNHKFCSRKCWCPTEKGRAISLDGYYVIDGRKVHRIIMEKYLGRKLLSTEIVHHINQDKLDNRLENLQIVSRSEHNKIHKSLKKV